MERYIRIVTKGKGIFHTTYHPDGFTLGWNIGEVYNQTILHCHLHVIPRYNDEPLAGKGIRYWLKQPENRREKRNKGSLL